jgi:hypothetical protein
VLAVRFVDFSQAGHIDALGQGTRFLDSLSNIITRPLLAKSESCARSTLFYAQTRLDSSKPSCCDILIRRKLMESLTTKECAMRTLAQQWKCLSVVLLLIPTASVLAEEDWTGEWLFRATPDGAMPLATGQKAWVDTKRKVVIVDGEVCLRTGPLEMFACPRNTKEYESVVVVDALPGIVHNGLLKIGAKPGSPAKFDPYEPASGTPIDVYVVWVDDDGKRHAVKAQEWIKDTKNGKPMDRAWVFGGSRFVKGEDKDRTIYEADKGDFICVANFSTASLDIPVKSSQETAALSYEAFEENIPAEKTKIRLVLVPKVAPAAKKRD